MNTRFGRAFRYEVRNYFRAVAILWLVMALIPAAMLAITYFLAGETAMEGSFNGYSIAVGMFGLVLGMVGLRENQRVLNQNGVSRRSAFLADVAALYWRLNKFWTILISVTVPLVLIFGSVPLISWLGTTSAGRAAVEALAAFGQFLAASPWNAAAVLLAMGAAFFALSWLLLRRAMIRPAK